MYIFASQFFYDANSREKAYESEKSPDMRLRGLFFMVIEGLSVFVWGLFFAR